MALPFKPPTRSRVVTWALAGLMLAPLAPLVRSAGDESYVVVVSSDVPMTDIDWEDLRRIFRFRQRFWGPHQPITVLYSEPNLTQESFLLRDVYGLDRVSLKTLILERLYSGEIDLAPKIVSSDEVAVSFVNRGHGMIALVRADTPGVGSAKTLSVAGKSPGSPGYPLRR